MARTVAFWEAQFNDWWTRGQNYNYSRDTTYRSPAPALTYGGAIQQSLNSYQQEHYYLGYHLTGLLNLWRATGNNAWLEELLLLHRNLISTAVPVPGVYGGTYLGWENRLNNPVGVSLWESICWRVTASLLRYMKGSPILLSTSNGRGGTYQDDYNTLLNFIERNIWEKFAGTSDNTTSGEVFRSRVHMISHWLRISLNLYTVTNKIRYKNFFDKAVFGTFPSGSGRDTRDYLLNPNQIRPNTANSNGVEWSQTWFYEDGYSIQDMSHANQVVSMMIDAYEQSYAFDQAFMNKLVVTLDQVLLVGNNYQLYYDIDGTGGSTYPSLFTRIGRAQEWMMLGRFNQALQDKIETNYVFGGPGDDYNLDYYASSVLGTMALNQKILNDGFAVYPENENGSEVEIGEIIWNTNFETVQWSTSGSASNGMWEMNTNSGRVTEVRTVTDARQGNQAIWLGSFNNQTERNELNVDRLLSHEEHWIGFSMKVINPVPTARTYCQFRNLPLGSLGSANPVTLRQGNNPGNFYFICTTNPAYKNYYDPNEINSGASPTADPLNSGQGYCISYPFTRAINQWMDIVIHWKLDQNDGFLEIWVDGEKEVDVTGTTVYTYAYAGELLDGGTFPTIGPYWSSSNSPQGDIYYDTYKVWKGPGGKYEDVSPLGLSPGDSSPTFKFAKKQIGERLGSGSILGNDVGEKFYAGGNRVLRGKINKAI